MKRLQKYVDGVLSGEIKTGRLVELAVERHVRDMNNPDLYFDEKTAEKAIKFCEICRHWKGSKAGERFVLEPWQVFYIGSIFGWKTSDGLRRFRRTFMEVARKNSKTTMLALMNLYHIIVEGQPGSQIYCAATKEDQARILVNDTGRIIETTPELRKKFKLFKYKDMITRVSYAATSSFIAALGRDSRTQDGVDPSMGNIDEFHEHQTTDLLNVIVSGMGARKEPLLNIITTAGFNKEYPCFNVTRKTALDVLEGRKEDDSSLFILYELDKKDKWDDKDVWIKANPNLGVSVELSFLESEFTTAKNEGTRTEVNFKTKYLNMWVDAPDVWITDAKWMRCVGKDLSTKGATCYGGLDLGKSDDMNAFVLLFTDKEPYTIKAWFWLPEAAIKKADSDLYNLWVKEGLIKVIPGEIARGNVIAEDILEIVKDYNLKSIAYDPYIATHECIPILDDNGLTLSPLSQNLVSLSPHTKTFQTLLLSKRLAHLGNPILRWQMSNVVLISDSNGNIKIDKKKSQHKIDGIAALINAVGQFMDFKEESNIYNSQDIRTI